MYITFSIYDLVTYFWEWFFSYSKPNQVFVTEAQHVSLCVENLEKLSLHNWKCALKEHRIENKKTVLKKYTK